MTYLEWVQHVHDVIMRDLTSGDDFKRNYGLLPHSVPNLFHVSDDESSTAVHQAVDDLAAIGVLAYDDQRLVTLGRYGRALNDAGTTTLNEIWPVIFKVLELSATHQEILVAMIGACEEERAEFAFQRTPWLHEITQSAGLNVSRADEISFLKATNRNHLTEGPGAMSGGVMLRPTYAGVVRATQRETSELERLIAELEGRWELPNVDFKRELSIETDEQKSEFVKDMIALATTQLPSDRYFLIGWDPKTRQFRPPGVDSRLTEEQLQQIIGSYCDPPPHLRYRTAPWRGGLAGIILVERNPRYVPYRVSRPIGRLRVGQTFVRHGTVTEAPTPTEEDALRSEAARAQ